MQVENRQDDMEEPGEPVTEQTKLGWTLIGPVELVHNNTQIKNSVICLQVRNSFQLINLRTSGIWIL